MLSFRWLAGAILVGGVALGAWVPASAQFLPHPPQSEARQEHVVEVPLVRQDQSDCENNNVNARDPSLIGGTAIVSRNLNGTTNVKVAITAKPNTTYHFFLKCVRQLGDITTYDEGEGNASFDFPTSLTGNTFAFDMYPEGAPSGDKYQSVKVSF